MVWLAFALIIFGFLLLLKGADIAIRIVVRLSRHFSLSEYVTSFLAVGVIAILPELAIGVSSALEGRPSFGLGIIFGSNIADFTLVVGVMAVFSAGLVLRDKVIKNSWMLLLAICLPVMLLFDGEISRTDGAILFVFFLFYCYKIVTSEHPLNKKFAEVKKTRLGKECAVLVFSLALLFVGGHIVTIGSEQISSIFRLPIFFVGAIAAVGTCFPELFFSIKASERKHVELGFGDIIGNVFADCTATIGIISLLAPIKPANNALAIFTGALMPVSLIILILLFNHKGKITKREGLFLIALYFAFLLLQSLAEIYTAG